MGVPLGRAGKNLALAVERRQHLPQHGIDGAAYREAALPGPRHFRRKADQQLGALPLPRRSGVPAAGLELDISQRLDQFRDLDEQPYQGSVALDATGHAIEAFRHFACSLAKLPRVFRSFVVAVDDHRSIPSLPCANAACAASIHPAARNFSTCQGTFRQAGGSAPGTYLGQHRTAVSWDRRKFVSVSSA
ncbi:hypothetical protein LB542_00660 [Mesorhizobium sp. BR1-1-9]|uniref:hypothetical protein n=1 Tax=unclassified Mesorhizobium TaxID=325217 RepID=UPI001CD0DDAF|nr:MULTISPECIES: hypothetical protein [unclassified Mesorhizobium]MBZ9869371.1 hypothetical protein [Mesorhizobium sp. BR1-1-9]MBZ9940901.1 hypothetical protein [Mesorhizobium sp. BR1-1-13]